nr:MAG TPA: hypothetical protein [Caudoviricetes sp.]
MHPTRILVYPNVTQCIPMYPGVSQLFTVCM